MMEYIDISILNPAEYNPRLLTNEAQEDLKKSIKELGIIKPIIIRQSDKRIMAGRTPTYKDNEAAWVYPCSSLYS